MMTIESYNTVLTLVPVSSLLVEDSVVKFVLTAGDINRCLKRLSL